MTRRVPSEMAPTTLAKPMMRTSTGEPGTKLGVELPPDLLLEGVGDGDEVELLPGRRVELEELGADDRPREVVRHEPADDAGLQDVAAHVGETLGVGSKSSGMTLPAAIPSSTTSV